MKFSVIIIISILLEVGFFNFSNIALTLDKSLDKNISYSLNEMEAINWKKDDKRLVSELDPMLIINNLNKYIRNIKIIVDASSPIMSTTIFYTNKENEVFNGHALILYNNQLIDTATIEVNKDVRDLRIDLGDLDGLELKSIKVIINFVQFNFSVSRVVAMVLIYMCGYALSALQKSPDYEVKNQLN